MSSALARGPNPSDRLGGSEPGVSGRRHAVFISDFLHLARPFPELAGLLMDPKGPWFGAAQRSAAHQRFTLTAGQPRQYDSIVIVPMHWEPVALERLVPALDVDVELSSLGTDHCRLSLSGRYRAPLVQLGTNLDHLAMHRVAESAVRRFLSEIAQALESV